MNEENLVERTFAVYPLENDLVGVYLPSIDNNLDGVMGIVGKTLKTYLNVVLKLTRRLVVWLLGQ